MAFTSPLTCWLYCSLDPRIKLLKQKEKEAREAKKSTGVAGGGGGKKTKAQEEEEKKRAEEEKLRKEEEEKVCLSFSTLISHFGSFFFFPFTFLLSFTSN